FEAPQILKASLLDEGSRPRGTHNPSELPGRRPGQPEAAYASPRLGAWQKMEGPKNVPGRAAANWQQLKTGTSPQ
ncbi:hypothetical protein chiPu_0022958, partial [Chiloscyllium punctatum]|nr:hypothetical protein [Chiloscyllium punctatum]